MCLLRQGKSDLYGPFWVCATLVFVVAVAGPAVLHVQGERVELGEEDALQVERVACGDSAPLPSLHVRVEVGRVFVGALGHRPVHGRAEAT